MATGCMPYGTFDDEPAAQQAPKRAVSGRRLLLSLSQRISSIKLQPEQREDAAKEAPESPCSVVGTNFEAGEEQ